MYTNPVSSSTEESIICQTKMKSNGACFLNNNWQQELLPQQQELNDHPQLQHMQVDSEKQEHRAAFLAKTDGLTELPRDERSARATPEGTTRYLGKTAARLDAGDPLFAPPISSTNSHINHLEGFRTIPPDETSTTASLDYFSYGIVEPTPIGKAGITMIKEDIEMLISQSMFCQHQEILCTLSPLLGETQELQEDLKSSPVLSNYSMQHTVLPTGSTITTHIGTTTTTAASGSRTSSDGAEGAAEDTESSNNKDMCIHPYQCEQWMERFHALVEYERKYRHCNVPYVYKDMPALGQWVKRQRHQYKLRIQGRHSNLTDDRIEMLASLGFVWDSHGAAWEEKLQDLIEFHKQRIIYANVRRDYAANPSLSTWVKRQRSHYKLFMTGKSSSMTQSRISKLEALGIEWDHNRNIKYK
jgi:hypothetical protein